MLLKTAGGRLLLMGKVPWKRSLPANASWDGARNSSLSPLNINRGTTGTVDASRAVWGSASECSAPPENNKSMSHLNLERIYLRSYSCGHSSFKIRLNMNVVTFQREKR